MGGGTDTTANLFCFVVYYLGHYPEVKQRLQQELDTVLGNDLTKSLTNKQLDELQYCDAVIKEVYRLSPITFIIGRVNTEKDMVGGFNWPEETSFMILYSALMKRKEYWTDPEKFDPDRFYKIDENDKYSLEKTHVKKSFTIFGGGIRICPGRKLAMIELKCLLALIYKKYDLEMADINEPLHYVPGMITFCKDLMIKVKPRKF
ncbi:cytochrome P450 [Glomus cerebriforme]|uniref:Cytochrome P450 n=1 Tax=Glomus cerebriforme TaxID=658196 RepID=A0A397TD95_9GLOM|nr:cytochrome P450 [Glomus cerebriforme]